MYERAAHGIPPEKVLMGPRAVEQMMVFYLRPRPVFFVTVDDGQHGNLFPMDLLGPLRSERFTLALRNTSPSVETIKRARRLALSDVPSNACKIAYKLGEHHKRRNIDWADLPFGLSLSREFSLPFPDIALRVREIDILDFQVVGSHTLFVGSVRSDQSLKTGSQLFHTSGIHQHWRARHGRPFQEVCIAEAT